MNKVPVVIETKDNYKDIALGLNSAIEQLKRNDIAIPPKSEEALKVALNKLNQVNDYNIDHLLLFFGDPAKDIIIAIKDALKDMKINFRDVPEGLTILQALSEIAKLIPDAFTEGIDLNWEEIEILIIVILREVREKINLIGS